MINRKVEIDGETLETFEDFIEASKNNPIIEEMIKEERKSAIQFYQANGTLTFSDWRGLSDFERGLMADVRMRFEILMADKLGRLTVNDVLNANTPFDDGKRRRDIRRRANAGAASDLIQKGFIKVK